MSEPTPDIAPADFDLDAWIDGSKPTERSCTITGRGDLVAQAETLLRRYEAAKRTPDTERGINDDTPESLAAAMEDLERQLDASRSTWVLSALTPEQVEAARKAADAAKPTDGDPEYTAHLVAAAVVRVVQPDGAVAEHVSVEQILRLRARLGDAVMMRLAETMSRAMSEEPSIQAPFSRTSSEGQPGRAS